MTLSYKKYEIFPFSNISNLSEYTLFKKMYKYFLSTRIIFYVKKEKIVGFLVVFFNLYPKFDNFINSDACIGKVTYEYIRLYPFFIQKQI